MSDSLTISRSLTTIFETIIPRLSVSEQAVYLRLCYHTHFQGTDHVCLRYDDLASACHLSISALQHALKGLRGNKLLTTTWHQKSPTLFHVHITPLTPKKPKSTLNTPAIYDRFTEDDRLLFLTAKRGLPPSQLEELEKEAADWLTDHLGDYNDTFLRDKIDELILQRTFGPDRGKKYESLFLHLSR